MPLQRCKLLGPRDCFSNSLVLSNKSEIKYTAVYIKVANSRLGMKSTFSINQNMGNSTMSSVCIVCGVPSMQNSSTGLYGSLYVKRTFKLVGFKAMTQMQAPWSLGIAFLILLS